MTLAVRGQKYDKVDLVVIKGRKLIRKKLSDKESLFYKTVGNKSYILMPRWHGKYAYFPYLSKKDITNKAKSYFIQAIEAIAEFHSQVKSKDFQFFPKIDYEKEVGRLVGLLEDKNLKEMADIAGKYFEELGEVDDVIHDDYIGSNILADGRGIKIIDWEDAAIGFGESDIGRLLGDLYFEEVDYKHRYYNFEWHDELMEVYVNQRNKLDKSYDKDKGRKRIILGELWNYLGPIEMSILHKDTDSEWYRKNVEAFMKTIKRIM